MSLPDCPECQRLKGEYAAATDARFLAEADLTSATFSHDAVEIKRVKQVARAKLARWAQAAEALRRHEQTHARTLTAGSIP